MTWEMFAVSYQERRKESLDRIARAHMFKILENRSTGRVYKDLTNYFHGRHDPCGRKLGAAREKIDEDLVILQAGMIIIDCPNLGPQG